MSLFKRKRDLRERYTIITLQISLNSKHINEPEELVCDISHNVYSQQRPEDYLISNNYSFFNCHLHPEEHNNSSVTFRFSFPYFNKTIRVEEATTFFPTIVIYNSKNHSVVAKISQQLDLNIEGHQIDEFSIKVTEDSALVKKVLSSKTGADYLDNKIKTHALD
jgi:hypothetical protein